MKSIFKLSILKTIFFNYVYCVKNAPLKKELAKWSNFIHFPFLIARNVKLKGMDGSITYTPGKRVSIGFGNIDIFDKKNERAIWNNYGSIVFHGSAHFGHGSRINNHGHLEFGELFGISANSTIDCDNNIIIGNNVLLSWDILIMDHDVHQIFDSNTNMRINNDETIIIGDNVWIGCRCTLLKGTKIGDNVVIAAGSLLTTDTSGNNCIIGNSGKILRDGIVWKR